MTCATQLLTPAKKKAPPRGNHCAGQNSVNKRQICCRCQNSVMQKLKWRPKRMAATCVRYFQTVRLMQFESAVTRTGGQGRLKICTRRRNSITVHTNAAEVSHSTVTRCVCGSTLPVLNAFSRHDPFVESHTKNSL